MSKGSSYWSTARGKIGNTVVSVVRGQRIEKAYQPVVTNPRTNAQMRQRARFANVVKFYKAATSQFFRFAYEDKKQTESEFNAFMRWNTNTKTSILKHAQVRGNYPAVGNDYVMSAGSLGNLTLSRGVDSILYLPSASLVGDNNTIGALSSAFINDYGLIDGDVVTYVRVETTISALNQPNPATLPKWIVKQFKVSASDSNPISSIDTHLNIAAGRLYLDVINQTKAYWYAIVFSRQTANGLKVSTSMLSGNPTAYDLFVAAQNEAWIDKALVTWKAAGDAILQGSLVSASAGGTITSVAGNAIPHISDTTLTSDVSSSAAVVGTGLKNIKLSDFAGKGLQVTAWTPTSDTAATITIKGTGEYPNSWVLYLGSVVLSQHSLVDVSIDSASPATSDVLGAGDSVSILLKGNAVDALKVNDLVASDDNLSLELRPSTTLNTINLIVKAAAEVSVATISYKDNVIFTIGENPVEITTESISQEGEGGSVTIDIAGTGLNSLTSESFSPSDASLMSITSYTPSKDGKSATIVLTISGTSRLYYGEKEIFVYIKTDSDGHPTIE